MEYISLYNVMRIYGSQVKETRQLINLNWYCTSQQFTNRISHPFEIENRIDLETHQEIQKVGFRDAQMAQDGYFGTHTGLDTFIRRRLAGGQNILPPVMEIEWMAETLGLSKTHKDVLIQISYSYIMHIWMFCRKYIALDDVTETTCKEFLSMNGALQELDNLSDCCFITRDPLPSIRGINFRIWNVMLFYSSDLLHLIKTCCDQSMTIKSLYLHAPIIMTLFMLDDYSGRIKEWNSEKKYEMEKLLKEICDMIDNMSVVLSNYHTYGMYASLTEADQTFLKSMYEIMYNKLSELNSNIGTISYETYLNMRDSKKTNANVRLSNMRINWSDEMRRAEKEKEKAES